MYRKILPECRHCGTRVEFFGNLCESCDSSGSEENALAQFDSMLMRDYASAEDY